MPAEAEIEEEHRLEITYVSVSDLKPWKKNPKEHEADGDVAVLVGLMNHYGFTNPILVQEGTDRIIAGHGRLEAAIQAGRTEVPVIYLPFNDVDSDGYTIADNASAERSKWNKEGLGGILKDLREIDFAPEHVAYTETEMANLIAEHEQMLQQALGEGPGTGDGAGDGTGDGTGDGGTETNTGNEVPETQPTPENVILVFTSGVCHVLPADEAHCTTVIEQWQDMGGQATNVAELSSEIAFKRLPEIHGGVPPDEKDPQDEDGAKA